MAWLKIDNEGWVVLPVAENANRVYVSASAGNDANDGSEGKPLRSLAAAAKKLDKARQNVVYLRRGDRFFEGFNLPVGGLSAAAPFVLAAYGDGERPQVRPASATGFLCHGKQFVAVVGIEFRADKRRPQDQGFSADATNIYGLSFTRSSFVWVEDCKVSLFANCNIGVQGGSDKREKEAVIRRNVIIDSYNRKGHSQGLYCQYLDGLILESNVFDSNGYLAGAASPTIFNHNAYIHGECGPAEVRGNIFARASATGVQARSGGNVVDNLFLYCPIAMTFGLVNGDGGMAKGGVTGSVVGNVAIGSQPIGTEKRGIGLAIGHTKPGAGVRVAGNIFACDPQQVHACIQIESGKGKAEADGVGLNDTAFEGNIVYRWKSALSVEDEMRAGGKGKDSINGCTVKGNRFEAGIVGGQKLGTIVPAPEVPYANPAVAEQDYSAFLAACREQSRSNWKPEFTAAAVIARVREGFKAKAEEPTPVPPPPPTPVPDPAKLAKVVLVYSDGKTVEVPVPA